MNSDLSMDRLISIRRFEEIPDEYQDSPVGLFLEYHNFERPSETYSKAEILIGMCMDNRKHLHIPDNFAFIIRAGGANLKHSEFKVSYAIGVGKIQHIVLIGHDNCGMVNLIHRKNEFINGLVELGGWSAESATEHFDLFAPTFEIGDEIDFILTETKRLRLRYPKVIVAPMFYKIEDNKLYLIKEDKL